MAFDPIMEEVLRQVRAAAECPFFSGGAVPVLSGARVRPDCLRIQPDGTVRVGLRACPAVWLGMLRQLGPVLHLVRNSVATAGRFGRLPMYAGQGGARDSAVQYEPDWLAFGALEAVRELTEAGRLYGFEARDARGRALEKIVLADEADQEHFASFVAARQAPPGAGLSWCVESQDMAPRERTLVSRIRWLRARAAAGAPDVQPLCVKSAAGLLRLAGHAGRKLRTTCYSSAVVFGFDWRPEFEAEPPPAAGAAERYFGPDASLHLEPSRLGGAWLWRGRCACCGDARWTVEFGDLQDRLALAFSCASGAGEREWRDFLAGALDAG